MLPHPLTNIEIQKCYQNGPRFNGIYSRDNLPKGIKDGAYVIDLHKYADIGTDWIALHIKDNEITCFDSFGVERSSKEIEKFIKHKYKHIQDTIKQFHNVWILLHWIH